MNLAIIEILLFISNCIYSSIFEQKSGDLVKVYIVALWPEGIMMATDAIGEIVDSKLFNIQKY